jgi:hypothetical protein
MGNELSRLFVVIGCRTDELNRGIQKASTDLKKLGAVMTGVGVGIVTSLSAITLSWANAGDEAYELSQKTGMSTESLSELRYAAQLSGSSLSGLETNIKRMQVTLTEAKDETSNAAKTLKELGLSYEELASLAPEQQFERITSSLADIADPTMKAALAIEMFGRSGTELLPMLSEGSAGLEAMRKEAKDLGIVFDQESAKKADAFKDSITRLKSAISGLGANIGEALAPILTKLANTISDVIQKVTNWLRQHPALTEAITKFAFAIGVACAAIGTFILVSQVWIKLGPLLGAALHAALGPLGLITLAITGLVAVGMLLITNWGRVVAFFHGPAAVATYELKQKIQNLSDTMITGVKLATSQMISNLQYEASVERSILEQRQAFWKDKQYEKMDILDDVMLAEIKAIDPALGARIEGINEEIKGIDAAGEARQRQADMDEAAAIRLQLRKSDLSKQEGKDLEARLAGIEDYWKRVDLIDSRNLLISGAKLDNYYAQQEAQLDAATASEVQHWQDVEKAFEDYHDQGLDYLKNEWLPKYQEIMKAAGMEVPQEVTTGIEDIMKPQPSQNPFSYSPFLHRLGVPGFQYGGVVTRPTLSLIGEDYRPEGVFPLSKLGSISAMGETHIHNHFGTFICDEISLRKFGRMLEQVLKENDRRNFFGQLQSGYGTGTSSI